MRILHNAMAAWLPRNKPSLLNEHSEKFIVFHSYNNNKGNKYITSHNRNNYES